MDEDLAHVRALCNLGAARLIRRAAGLSLGRTARLIELFAPGHIPKQTLVSMILRWERGEDLPSGDEAVAYGRILDVLLRQQNAGLRGGAVSPG